MRVNNIIGVNSRTFFCPLCGVALTMGSLNYWCDEHAAFDVLMVDDQLIVRKTDAVERLRRNRGWM